MRWIFTSHNSQTNSAGMETTKFLTMQWWRRVRHVQACIIQWDSSRNRFTQSHRRWAGSSWISDLWNFSPNFCIIINNFPVAIQHRSAALWNAKVGTLSELSKDQSWSFGGWSQRQHLVDYRQQSNFAAIARATFARSIADLSTNRSDGCSVRLHEFGKCSRSLRLQWNRKFDCLLALMCNFVVPNDSPTTRLMAKLLWLRDYVNFCICSAEQHTAALRRRLHTRSCIRTSLRARRQLRWICRVSIEGGNHVNLSKLSQPSSF